MYTALPEHQRVNRAAKADALVSSSELKLLALKVPGLDIAGIDEPTMLPAPISGTNVLDTNQNCVPPEEVLHRFQADQNEMGAKWLGSPSSPFLTRGGSRLPLPRSECRASLPTSSPSAATGMLM